MTARPMNTVRKEIVYAIHLNGFMKRKDKKIFLSLARKSI